MSFETLKEASNAVQQHSMTLAHGMAAMGDLLASATSGDIGLSRDTATDIGWLLNDLGKLTASLVDLQEYMTERLAQAPRPTTEG